MWVFGYGSLIWNPGFEYQRSSVAILSGYARSFCIRSIYARGTKDNPGLGLALTKSPGAYCEGVAFAVTSQNTDAVIAYLRERELVSSAYLEMKLGAKLKDGVEVQAITYVADTNHVQFVSELSLEEQAQSIASAAGNNGPNSEYLFNTVEQLSVLGISDPKLKSLAQRVRSILG